MARVLTDADVRLLQQQIDTLRRQLVNPQNRRGPDEPDITAPEVYVARIPTGGIGAIVGIQPQSSECAIYRLIPSGGVNVLAPIPGLTRTVYNLATRAVLGDRWLLTNRDKFGNWFVDNPVLDDGGGDVGTGTGGITGTGTDILPTGTGGCDAIEIVESTIRCDDGNFNLYRRTLTVDVNESGCVTREAGDWAAIDNVACSCYKLPGINFDDLTITEDPSYILAIDPSGCLVRVDVGECPEDTGTGTEATGGGGETNTASNVGTGAGVFKQKNGVDLELRSVLGSDGIITAAATNEVTVKLNFSNITSAIPDARLDFFAFHDFSAGAHRKENLDNIFGNSAVISDGSASNTNLGATDRVIYFTNTTGNNRTATLPSASGATGRIYHFIKATNVGNGQVVGLASGLQDTLIIPGETLSVHSDGTNWQILHDGRVPCKFKAERQAAQSMVTGTWDQVEFDTEVYDNANGGDVATTWDYTIPRAGVYRVTTNGYFGGASGQAVMGVGCTLNGIANFHRLNIQQTGGAVQNSASVSEDDSFAAGDVIEMVMFHNATANQNTAANQFHWPSMSISEILD